MGVTASARGAPPTTQAGQTCGGIRLCRRREDRRNGYQLSSTSHAVMTLTHSMSFERTAMYRAVSFSPFVMLGSALPCDAVQPSHVENNLHALHNVDRGSDWRGGSSATHHGR